MGIFSKIEGKMEDALEGAAGRMAGSSISPVQIAKKAEKQMRREKMVGAGKQYAPTLYTVLVSFEDDDRLFGYYPTLAGETETYLAAKATEQGLVMDGQPLVRFIADEGLKRGKFDVIAEAVAAPIVAQLRQEEMERYGLSSGYDSSEEYEYADEYSYANDFGSSSQDRIDSPYMFEEEAEENSFVPQTMMFEHAQVQAQRQEPKAIKHIPSFSLVDTATNRVYKLKNSCVKLGRETVNDIILNDINASREHAELRQDEQRRWYITDLGSTNGTFVNGQEISKYPLTEGDRITIGMTTLLFTRV